MKSLFTFTSQREACSYLPSETSRMRYDIAGEITTQEYADRMQIGWRRFGHSLFKPECDSCRACRAIRVDVKRFQSDRSQRRAVKANKDVRIQAASPIVDDDRLALYDHFHAYQSETIGWPRHSPENAESYAESFVFNPFMTQEWTYYLADRLIGVGFVDVLPGGLSAIYFFYDPEFRDRSLGTFNVMNIIRSARIQKLPYVYLGYYVEGCRSLAYKANFKPNELLTHATGEWTAFRE